jgi:hypothetical protein
MTEKSIVLHILELDEERKTLIGHIHSYSVSSVNLKRYEEIQAELRQIEKMWNSAYPIYLEELNPSPSINSTASS